MVDGGGGFFASKLEARRYYSLVTPLQAARFPLVPLSYRAVDGDGRRREQRHIHSRDEDREEDGDEERDPEDPRFQREVENPRDVDVIVSRFQTVVDAERLLQDSGWVG